MENASKALIIAGAILISIVIIGLGVVVVRNVTGIAQNTNLNSQEAQAHNADFTAYFGTHVSGSNVKALIDLVKANNRKATSEGTEYTKIMVYLKDTDITTTAGTANGIKTSAYYNVDTFTEDASDKEDDKKGYWNNGYIKTIKITEVSGTSGVTPT